MIIFKKGCLLLLFLSILGTIHSQNKKTVDKSQDQKIKNLNKKIEVLTEELVKQKTGEDIYKPVSEKGKYGFAPAASKVYEKNYGVSIGGYGEITYVNQANRNQTGETVLANDFPDKVDVLRTVLYFGYKFTDSLLLNTEIEYEHANELGIEFAYLDYLWKSYLNFRAGLLLSPLGFINQLHEPSIFLGVDRPQTERYIIPTTWREVGAGIFGSWGGFNYKLYVMNSFNGAKFSSEGFRGGRQKGSKAFAEDFGGAVRIDYETLGFIIGISSYVGQTGQIQVFKALASVSDFHADFKWRGLYLRGLVSFSILGDVKEINNLGQLTGNQSIGEQMIGMYGEVGYDVLSFFNTTQIIILFSRYEFINTQYKVPSGFEKDPKNETTLVTFGLSYKPIINIAVKLDYQLIQKKSETGVNKLNIALTYLF